MQPILRKINFLFELVSYYLFSRVVVKNKTIVFPRRYRIGLGDFLAERWSVEIIDKLFKNETGVFLDVGFNMGQTLVKVKSVAPWMSYVGFEPNPICYYFVTELVKVNDFKNVILIAVGLSDEDKVVELFSRDSIDGSATIIKDFRDQDFYRKTTFVPVCQGDILLKQLNLGKISVIKIDVEGAEVEVIYGLKDVISTNRPSILCEILPIYDPSNKIGQLRKERQDKLETFLQENNYGVYRIMKNGHVASIPTIGIHSDMSLRDYIFVPKEKALNL